MSACAPDARIRSICAETEMSATAKCSLATAVTPRFSGLASASVIATIGVLTGGIRRREDRDLGEIPPAEVGETRAKIVVGGEARREDPAPGRRMHARRIAPQHRAVRLEQAGRRVAERRQLPADDDRRLLREELAHDLHGDLRVGLIVGNHELDRAASDPAGAVHEILGSRDRLCGTRPDEGGWPRQRLEGVDFERLFSRRTARERERPRDDDGGEKTLRRELALRHNVLSLRFSAGQRSGFRRSL